MNEPHRTDGLEVSEDLEFTGRSWRVQRIGRVIWIVLVAAAFLGAFGRGWLANGRARDADAQLSAEYERITHNQAPSRMTISVAPGAVSGGDFGLWIDREYLSQGTLRMILPEPDRSEITASRIIYVFHSPDSEQGAKITFDFEPESLGRKEIRLGLIDGPELKFNQYILP
jgi:hypothetical protein